MPDMKGTRVHSDYLNPFNIRTKNSIYEFEPENNRFRLTGVGWQGPWQTCIGSQLLQPIEHMRYDIPRYGEAASLSTSCVREIFH